MLTYDTTLQVVSRTPQRDFLNGLFLFGGHFLLLFSSVCATAKGIEDRKLSSTVKPEEVGSGRKGRTSCWWWKTEVKKRKEGRGASKRRRGDGGWPSAG